MTTELRTRNQAQQLYVRALSSAWRNNIELHDPSLWLLREPELEEKMLRDADIAHAVQYRRHMIAGQRWSCTARVEGSARAPMAVAVATELLGGIKNFTQARLNLARAFFSGARFGYIQGAPKRLRIGDGIERTWWVPTHIEDRDKRFYRTVPKIDDMHGTLTAHWEVWDLVATQFVPETIEHTTQTIRHVYQDDQASLGHGRGLREALGWWWYAKEHVFQESLQAVERFAQGVMTAKVDGARDAETGLPNTELIREWRNVLEDLRSRHVLVFDKSDEVEMVQMNSQGWELLHTIRDELKNTIFTLILGANLTTGADEGGSYALAAIQENSTEALIQYDRETLEETLTDDLLGCLWFKNHANLVELGIAEEKPRFSVSQEKREDPKERADVAAVLSGMGVPLSVEDVLEQTGFRKVEPGEDVVTAPAPAPDPFGGGGFGGDPFGGVGGGGGMPTPGGQSAPAPAPQDSAPPAPAPQPPEQPVPGREPVAEADPLAPFRPQPLPFAQDRAPAGSKKGGQFLPKDGDDGGKTDDDKDGDADSKPEPKAESKPAVAPRKATEAERETQSTAQAARREARANRAQTEPANPDGKVSRERHQKDGEYTPARKAMHEEIVALAVDGVPSSDAPTVYFMGGGPAAGKSSMIHAGAVTHPDLHVLLDPDEFKADLPDYRDKTAAGDFTAAADAHNESSDLTQQTAEKAAGATQDVVWDGTGDGSTEKMLERIELFRSKGYRVQGDYATIDTQEAVDRATKRAAETGREVPEAIIRKTHASVSRIWPELAAAGAFDESSLFDTTSREPKKIASASRSGEITIHDQKAYDAFIAKGK